MKKTPVNTVHRLCYVMLHFLLHWQIANLEKDNLPAILIKKNVSLHLMKQIWNYVFNCLS